MKTVKLILIGLNILLTCQLYAQEVNNSQKEELKTKILNELRNEKIIYYFMEKVIPKKQTNGEASDVVYKTLRMYANKKHKQYGGSIDAIFFSHDTLCFNVDEYIIHSYPWYSFNDETQPKGGKLEAKTIYVPIRLKKPSFEHKDKEWDGRDDIYLMNIQIFYNGIMFGWNSPKEIEERVSHAKTLHNLLLNYQRVVEQQHFDKAIEIFKAEVNRYKEKGEKATISEEQRKLIVQANAATDEKQYETALDLYNKALNIDKFSYPESYNNMALISAAINDFLGAIFEIKQYMLLVPPDADAARKIQDKIYEWEYKYNQDLKTTKP